MCKLLLKIWFEPIVQSECYNEAKPFIKFAKLSSLEDLNKKEKRHAHARLFSSINRRYVQFNFMLGSV